MKRFIMKHLFAMSVIPFLLASIVVAGILYNPLPTAKVVWEEFKTVQLEIVAKILPYDERHQKNPTLYAACVAEANKKLALLGERYVEVLQALAIVYEEYGEEEDYKRFKDTSKDLLETVDKVLEEADTCDTNVERGLNKL